MMRMPQRHNQAVVTQSQITGPQEQTFASKQLKAFWETSRGKALLKTEPRAAFAHYDRTTGRVMVELTNGCTFAFPARLAQGLENATDAELAAVEVLGLDYGLHWEVLDADLSVSGLLAGRFGTKSYMARLIAR